MLDTNGGLSIWNCVELAARDMGGSLQDFCLGVGGKVKLVKSAFIDIAAERHVGRTLSLQVRPGDASHALIGTGFGTTLHHVRHGATASPTQYDGYYGDDASACDVIAVQHSPFLPQYFLAATSDGTVCLYHESNPRPLHTWADFTTNELLGVLWSPSQPHLFFGYASSGEVLVWDLVKDPLGPCHSQRLDAKSMNLHGTAEDTSLVTCCFSARGVGHPYLAASYRNGCVSIHTLSGLYSSSTAHDVRHMRAFLEGVPFESIVDEPEPEPEEPAETVASDNPFDDAFDFGLDPFGDPFSAVLPAKQGRRAKAGRRG